MKELRDDSGRRDGDHSIGSWAKVPRGSRAFLRRRLRSEIRRRLEAWARWWQGDTELARASPYPAYNRSLIRGTEAAGTRLSTPGVLSPELEQTDKALDVLTRRQHKALMLHYLHRASPDWKAKECRLPRSTFYRVVYKASMLFLERCDALKRGA